MPSDRLKEAMKATRYTHQDAKKASQHTGKAFEEPREPIPARPSKPTQQERQREKRAFRINRQDRDPIETTEDQVERAERVADGSEAPRPSRRPVQPPDPFPLEYRDGDPDAEFDPDRLGFYKTKDKS